MTKKKKPMLASAIEDVSLISFPVLASVKMDGIRCLVVNGEPLSRTFKPIRNKYLHSKLRGLPDFDGELMIRNGGTFQDTTSLVMSIEGEPSQIVYDVFDLHNTPGSYKKRYGVLKQEVKKYAHITRLVKQKKINTIDELLEFEQNSLAAGYEGVMVRDPAAKYKYGRSSLSDGALLKLKRFKDDEAKVVGFVEKMHNENEAKKDAFGNTERSSSKEGKRPANTLGKLIVERNGIEFGLGTGFDDELRKEIWTNRKKYLDKYVKFKYQEVGVKKAPRFPVFLGFRDVEDM